MSKTLDEYQAEIGAWGDATFPNSTYETVMAHFAEEAEELVMAAYRDADGFGDYETEAADCFILLMQFAHKRQFSLFAAAESKMAINRARAWKRVPEPAGHFKHLAPSCRVCGCTDDDCSGCVERTGVPCFWVEPDLCSACAAEPVGAR